MSVVDETNKKYLRAQDLIMAATPSTQTLQALMDDTEHCKNVLDLANALTEYATNPPGKLTLETLVARVLAPNQAGVIHAWASAVGMQCLLQMMRAVVLTCVITTPQSATSPYNETKLVGDGITFTKGVIAFLNAVVIALPQKFAGFALTQAAIQDASSRTVLARLLATATVPDVKAGGVANGPYSKCHVALGKPVPRIEEVMHSSALKVAVEFFTQAINEMLALLAKHDDGIYALVFGELDAEPSPLEEKQASSSSSLSSSEAPRGVKRPASEATPDAMCTGVKKAKLEAVDWNAVFKRHADERLALRKTADVSEQALQVAHQQEIRDMCARN
jgi:hypothetical protein